MKRKVESVTLLLVGCLCLFSVPTESHRNVVSSALGVSLAGIMISSTIAIPPPLHLPSNAFLHRLGSVSDESLEEEDEEDNKSQARVEPQITPQNRDACLAKFLCGLNAASASGKANYMDYAQLINSYFNSFADDKDQSKESEEEDDYSIEEEQEPSPPPKPVPGDKFDISLLGVPLDKTKKNESDIQFSTTTAPTTEAPATTEIAKRVRGHGKIKNRGKTNREARARKIVAQITKKGQNCQSIAGCPFTFKQLQQKLRPNGPPPQNVEPVAVARDPEASFESLHSKYQYFKKKPSATSVVEEVPKPLKFAFHELETAEADEPQRPNHKDVNRGDDELEEIFGPASLSYKKGPKGQSNAVTLPPPTVFAKPTPNVITMIIKDGKIFPSVAPSPKPKPKKKKVVVVYKQSEKRKPGKDNGDDEDDDINKTLPVKLITSAEINIKRKPTIPFPLASLDKPEDDTDDEYDDDTEYYYDDGESDEYEDDEDDDDDEDEEEDDEPKTTKKSKGKKKSKNGVSKSKGKKKIAKQPAKPQIYVEGDDEGPKDKPGKEDDEHGVDDGFFAGLSFGEDTEKPKRNRIQPMRKYKVNKNKKNNKKKSQMKSDEEEGPEPEDETEDEEEEDEADDEDQENARGETVTSALSKNILKDSMAFSKEVAKSSGKPKRKSQTRHRVNKRPVAKNTNKKRTDIKIPDSGSAESSEEHGHRTNFKAIFTAIGGRPLAPPPEPTGSATTKNTAVNNSPFKFQFISPHSKDKGVGAVPTISPMMYKYTAPQTAPQQPAALTSAAFLPNAQNQQNQQNPVAGGMITGFFSNFFRKPPQALGNQQQVQETENNSPPPAISSFVHRPVGPESSHYKRPGSSNKKKDSNKKSTKERILQSRMWFVG